MRTDQTARKNRRSNERREFLTGILVTAIEAGTSGTGSWATIVEYEHTGDDPHAVVVHSDAVEYDPETNEYTVPADAERLRIDHDVITRGIGLIRGGAGDFSEKFRKLVAACSHSNDCSPDHISGDIDSIAADNIVQAGLFGEIRYT